MEIIKLICVGILICIIIVITKQVKPELGIAVIIIGGIIMLLYILSGFSVIMSFFNEIISKTGINSELFSIVIKIVAVGYLIEFANSICIDTGNSSIADKINLGGKVIIFTMSLPIISNLFNIVLGLIK